MLVDGFSVLGGLEVSVAHEVPLRRRFDDLVDEVDRVLYSVTCSWNSLTRMYFCFFVDAAMWPNRSPKASLASEFHPLHSLDVGAALTSPAVVRIRPNTCALMIDRRKIEPRLLSTEKMRYAASRSGVEDDNQRAVIGEELP